jgi:hypothetical protein
MVFLIITVSIAIIMSVVLLLRSRNPTWLVFPALGWIGGGLVLCSLILLPWISCGPPGTIGRNATWLASKTEIIKVLGGLPEFMPWNSSMAGLKADDILKMLEHPAQRNLIDAVDSGRIVSGLIHDEAGGKS